jgi:hypothetical protein
MTGPKRPADLLPGILEALGTSARRAEFSAALESCLHPAEAALCRVLGFRGGCLTVEVDSAPLYAELTGFRAEDLRLAMNDKIKTDKIARLKFRPGFRPGFHGAHRAGARTDDHRDV